MCEKYYSVSPYVYCHNNPVNKFDADGYTDYFSNTGIYLYSEGKTPNISVQRNNRFVDLNTLDLRDKNNMQTAANIIGHYAREVGIQYNQNGGTGTVGLSTLHRTDGFHSDILAATTNGNIYMKVVNGKLHHEMYNSYNLRGTLLHENEHKKIMKREKPLTCIDMQKL